MRPDQCKKNLNPSEFMKAAPEVPPQRFPNVAAAVEALKFTPPTGLLVLVKGSRGVRLEEVVGVL